jgi:hypothetical protein
MAAADVARYIEVNDPTREVVVLTLSSGETYTSKKFSTITSAIACYNEATGQAVTELVVTYSGGVATITSANLADKLVALQLTGRK